MAVLFLKLMRMDNVFRIVNVFKADLHNLATKIGGLSPKIRKFATEPSEQRRAKCKLPHVNNRTPDLNELAPLR